jgi:hypothetical protein
VGKVGFDTGGVQRGRCSAVLPTVEVRAPGGRGWACRQGPGKGYSAVESSPGWWRSLPAMGLVGDTMHACCGIWVGVINPCCCCGSAWSVRETTGEARHRPYSRIPPRRVGVGTDPYLRTVGVGVLHDRGCIRDYGRGMPPLLQYPPTSTPYSSAPPLSRRAGTGARALRRRPCTVELGVGNRLLL